MKPDKPNIRKRFLALAVLGIIVIVSAIQGYAAENYPDRNSPYYAGKYATEDLQAAETLTVVSYNIWFAEDIDGALSELRQIELQKGLDILLLQEMDETGTEQIAQELRLNYVYFPAAVEPTYNRNFGNAILSRWPIVDAQKLILPHKSLSNRMNRIATRATIRMHATDILVYSIHTESIFTVPRFREDQYRAVVNDIDPEVRLVIIGGDFNSFTKADVSGVERVYDQAGIVRASAAAGHTMAKYGIELSADHIFTKGFLVKDAGTLSEATASDHVPLWVSLSPK